MSNQAVKIPTNINLKGGVIRLGIDRPTGQWFCHVFDERTAPVEAHEEIDRETLMNLIRQYGDMGHIYTKNVFRAISLDLDPSTLPAG